MTTEELKDLAWEETSKMNCPTTGGCYKAGFLKALEMLAATQNAWAAPSQSPEPGITANELLASLFIGG